MQLKGFRLFRLGGIDIIVDYSWFVIFLLVIYSMAVSYFPQTREQSSMIEYWIMGFVTAILLFASVLLHELAHSLVAVMQGIRVASIRLFIFGGIAQIESEPRSGRSEFLIALAGPAASMLLGLIFAAFYAAVLLSGSKSAAGDVAAYLAFANILLAVFNMIPGFPLDGGRILRAVLWDRWDDITRATGVVSRIGGYFAVFLIVLGVLQILLAQNLVSGLWMVFIGWFLKSSASGSYRAIVIRESLAGVSVREIMTENVVSVDWLTPLSDLVSSYIYKHHFTHFPVLNNQELSGMVSLAQVKSVPKELWIFKQVRDVMTPIEQVPRLGPSDDATEAFSRIFMEGMGHMPVVEEGRLVGIVSRRDIQNLFKIRSHLGIV